MSKSIFLAALTLTILGLMAAQTVLIPFVAAPDCGPGCYSVHIRAPVLLNPQPLPPGVASSVSLTAELVGTASSLTGTVTVRAIPPGPPNHPPDPCVAAVTGSVQIQTPIGASAPGPADVVIVIPVQWPPSPCSAGLQGQSLTITVHIFTGATTLAFPPGPAQSQWSGQAGITLKTQPPGPNN